MKIQNKKACVKFAAGCPRNMLDAEVLIEYLKKNSWTVVDDIKQTKIIFIGVCGFDQQSERISKINIKFVLREKNKNALCIPFGCLFDINPSVIKERKDLIPLSYLKLDKIDTILQSEKKINTLPRHNVLCNYKNYNNFKYRKTEILRIKIEMLMNNPAHYFIRHTIGIGPSHLRPTDNKDYYIKINKGCTGNCSYCAIKSAAGKMVSYPVEKILKQFKKGLSEGYKVFRLLGEDVGAYGNDCGSSIVILLEEIYQNDNDFQLVIEDFSPRWVIKYQDDLLRLIKKNTNRIHHIVIPIQTGSETIVRKMRRGYHVDQAVEAIRDLRMADKNLKISTHIIVGFPGETEQDFKATIDVLAALNFDHIEAHFYSDRPQCASVQFSDKVSDIIKIWRLWRLRKKFTENCRIRI